MRKIIGTISVAIVFLLCDVFAYPRFKQQIPNAANIPDPCDRTKTWNAIGHKAAGGGGALTPFGTDFAAAGNKFTKEFCMKDSDGDGKSNGVELGDPNCVWAVNATPAITDRAQLSHPGVCEPLNAPQCAGKNVFLNSACLAAAAPAVTTSAPTTSSSNNATTSKVNNNVTATAAPAVAPSTTAINKNSNNASMTTAKGGASSMNFAQVSIGLPTLAAILFAGLLL